MCNLKSYKKKVTVGSESMNLPSDNSKRYILLSWDCDQNHHRLDNNVLSLWSVCGLYLIYVLIQKPFIARIYVATGDLILHPLFKSWGQCTQLLLLANGILLAIFYSYMAMHAAGNKLDKAIHTRPVILSKLLPEPHLVAWSTSIISYVQLLLMPVLQDKHNLLDICIMYIVQLTIGTAKHSLYLYVLACSTCPLNF